MTGLLSLMSFCGVLLSDTLGEVSTCIPGEYVYNNQCCPKCPSGSVVKTHCSDFTSTVCIPCIDGTYIDHPNGITKCLRCKTCDRGAGLITKKACTYTSNTECDCENGSFCDAEDSKDCDLCQKHKTCYPGERVKQKGTKRTDVVCEKCPEGTFRNETMSDCIPWTKCSSGLVEKAGTSTSDIICGSAMRQRWVLAPFAAIIFILLCCLVKHLRNTEDTTTSMQDIPDAPVGVQETGIQLHPDADTQLPNR